MDAVMGLLVGAAAISDDDRLTGFFPNLFRLSFR